MQEIRYLQEYSNLKPVIYLVFWFALALAMILLKFRKMSYEVQFTMNADISANPLNDRQPTLKRRMAILQLSAHLCLYLTFLTVSTQVVSSLTTNFVTIGRTIVSFSCSSFDPPVWDRTQNDQSQNLAVGDRKLKRFKDPR